MAGINDKYKVLGIMLLIFIITQMLGLYTGVTLTLLSIEHPELEETFNVAPAPRGDMFNTLFFFVGVLLGAGVMLLVIRFYKGKLMFKFLEFAVVCMGSSIVIFSLVLVLGIDTALVIGLLCGVIIAVLRFIMDQAIVRNSAAVLASAGLGAVIGYSIGLVPAVIFGILLAIYDIFAVFIAKFMIKFAQHFSGRNLSFSVVASSGKYKSMTMPVQKAEQVGMKVTPEEMKKGSKQIKVKEVHLELGTGDLVIPLVLCVATFQSLGMLAALMVMVGSVIGLGTVLVHVLTRKSFMPALPYIIGAQVIVLAILVIFG